MPSVFSHAVVATALGTAFHRRRDPLRFWLLGALCAVLPDLDVLGFWLGVPYAAPLGHRGLSHSLAFAALLGVAVAALAFRAGAAPSRARVAAFLALATASHGVLDALTDGGLGVALLAPFSDARFFAPLRPIRVAPLEPAGFFSPRGLAVFQSELIHVWLPALGFAAAALALRRRRTARAARALPVAALAAALLLPAAARAADCDAAPYPLRQRDPLLQQRLERELRGAGMGEALDARRLTVSLVDLTHPDDVHYAGLHDDHMLYAASLPKIAILLTLFESLERGALTWNDAFRWKLQKMINISDNAQATWAAEQVGLPAIAAVMRDPRYCFYEDGVGGLWAGRGFAKGGPTLREPLRNLSHASSARQAARFFVLLERGALVSPGWSRYMRHLMAPPEYQHKFVAGLRGRPGVEFLARKSGTWTTFHSDGALVQHGHVRYVLAALADHPDGEGMLRRLAGLADDIMWEGRHRAWVARTPLPGGRR